jgi:hypothetical protein
VLIFLAQDEENLEKKETTQLEHKIKFRKCDPIR